MAHWFHRNPFKATAVQNFDVRKIAMKNDFSKVISDLRTARTNLLALFNDPLASPEKMDTISTEYFSLIQGLFEVPEGLEGKNTAETSQSTEESSSKKEESGKEDKPVGAKITLKTFFKFKWTQTLFVGKPPLVEDDAEFDFINMGVNIALWYTKHAAKLSAQAEIKMEDAKEIHSCMKKAAGIFKEFRDNHVGKLSNPPEKCSDMDSSVLDCYIMCCQAEAQEVTIARAVEMKHKASLIAGLANETSKYFQMADDHLKSLDQGIVGKWRKYLQLKQSFYKSYALCYHGGALLAEEKCGLSIRCLQDSTDMFAKTTALCKEYMATKGAGSTIRPQEHEFYRNFEKDLNRKFEKSKSENGFIYHQKVPPVAPNIDFQATHGLVDPTPYSVPEKSSAWTSGVYAGFNVSKNVQNDKKFKPEKEQDVKPIKEPDIKVTKDNGCVIS
uniref:BRO1 domain-containing protein BROX n=1 Tax=Phallusia mammillata TaxID=59560 RepID=A0A6F9D780_9ASCI|nr:BRO1 domain-containing protein BROX-like [Phallusia mammillata]